MTDASRDRLRELWDMQVDFLADVDAGFDQLPLGERLQATKEAVLHAQTELVELLNEVPWKTWLRRPAVEPNVAALTEEAVDVIKFVMNVLLMWGVSADAFYDAFARKTEVNINRHLQHVQLRRLVARARRGSGRSMVAALDLDGVLAAYPEHWLAYLEHAEGLPAGTLDVGTFSLVYGLGVESVKRQRYSRLKEAYRTSGGELEVAPLPGAAEFTQQLRALGYTVVIVSARPVDRYKRLYSDTVRWLRAHGVAYDAILWEPVSKEDKIISELPGVDFVLEDDPVNVERLVRAGIRAYLLDRPYNKDSSFDGVRVRGFDDLLARVRKGAD